MNEKLLLDDIKARAQLTDLIRFWRRRRILVVTDGIVSFGPEHDPNNLQESYFGMSHLMSVLSGQGEVTRAHRQIDPLHAAGVIENFRFDAHDLTAYDQIWLMGYNSYPPLSAAEQEKLARFMNGGGGVFATGDHENLGAAISSQLPRVRSMRHWSAPPSALGSDRIDTTMPDHNGVLVFENQSDDIPQTLTLKWYVWGETALFLRRYPHPLLCSPAGPITEFPDHMHEGEVVAPTDLTQSMSVNGYTFDEYPKTSDGTRLPPEIVAWGRSEGRPDPEVMSGIHTGSTQASASRLSGTVGAYDGRRVGVGRVVVDATWHHFFDINLIGDNAANRPGFNDPRKALWSKGFTYSAEGQQTLAQIDQYYRNIVNWLSPNWFLDLWGALVIELALHRDMRELLAGRSLDTASIGAAAWQIARRLHPPCLVIEISSVFWDLPRLKPRRFGPWDWPYPAPDDGPGDPPLPFEWLAKVALGAGVQVMSEAGARQRPASMKAQDIAQAAMGRAAEALASLARSQQASADRLAELAKAPPRRAGAKPAQATKRQNPARRR